MTKPTSPSPAYALPAAPYETELALVRMRAIAGEFARELVEERLKTANLLEELRRLRMVIDGAWVEAFGGKVR